MSAVAFDTHAAVKTLREAGADEAMAEAIVNTAGAAAGARHDDLATKADIADTKADIAELRASTKADLARLETRLTNALATKAELQAAKAELQATKAELRVAIDPLASKDDLAAAVAGVRGELGIIRWAVGLNAAFLFVIVVRVFGLI